MKTIIRACAVACPLALVWTSSLFAQAASPAPASTASDPKKDEALVLSPFEVSAGSDEGYAARETLAGTRFKS